jgi:hypothetical protein
MSYFLFINNLNNIEGSFYRMAENQYDLDNLNIEKNDYKIIEDSHENFDLVKYGNKFPIKYNNDNIIFIDQTCSFIKKEQLQHHINNFKDQIKQFTDNNLNHTLYNRWNNYYNQLSNLDLNSIIYPLNKSLEQYFKDQNQTSLSPLQVP